MTEICHSNLPCHGACCILRLRHPSCKNEPQTYLRCSAETRSFTSPLFLKCISDDPQNCLSALVILRSTSNVPPAKQFFRNRVPQTYLKESHFWEVPFQSEIVLDWLKLLQLSFVWVEFSNTHMSSIFSQHTTSRNATDGDPVPRDKGKRELSNRCRVDPAHPLG